jgi:hypothetical protein
VPARVASGLLVAGGLTYLLVPGHPLSLLRGVPLDWLGLTALIGLGCLVLAFGWPFVHSGPFPAKEGVGPLSRWERGGVRAALILAVLALVAGKLALWYLAPTYGLAASYYARARVSGAPERSTEYRSAPFTRIDRSPGQPGLALHFFNDVERFNYYEPPDPDRRDLPFAVRWDGYLQIPDDGSYPLALTARGTAVLAIDGAPTLTVGSRDDRETDAASLRLTSGAHPVRLEFMHQGGGGPWLAFEAPTLTVEPYSRETLARDRIVALAAACLDGLALAGLLAAGAVATQRRARQLAATGSNRAALLERPLLAGLLLVVLAYALVTTAGLTGRAVILEGGQDWLTYESYARDILLNGPLMTLGEPLGKGKPYFFQPFYPYYLAGLHWLTGEGLWGPIVLQVFGTGLAGVFVYYLGKRLFGLGAGVTGLALFLVLGLTQLDWIARKLLSENLYFVVLPAAILLLVRVIDERRLADVAWAGLLLGVASITRAPTLLFVPGAALIVALAWRRAGLSLRRAAVAFVLLGLTTAVVAALVPLRNFVVSGRPALVATNGGATLLLAHQPTDRVRLSGVDRDPLYNALKLDRATREVVEFVRQDPTGYLWTLVPLGLYSIGVSGAVEGFPPLAPDVLAITGLYVLAVVLLPGARALRALPLHLFVLLHLAIMMTFLPYVYGYRQVLPMQVLMLVFDGGLLVWIAGRLAARRQAGPTGQPVMEQRTA